jgi:hypothetical protein
VLRRSRLRPEHPGGTDLLPDDSGEYIDDRGDIFGHGVYPNDDSRMFLLLRDPSVPLPGVPPRRRALPSTGQPDEHPSQVLAVSVAGRDRMVAGIQEMIRDRSR